MAQFKVAGKDVQVHGFFQQGFAVSSGNNFLTMKTTNGSFSMTDGGFNVATRLTPKLRVGAQVFSRNIGDIANGKVALDWAFADYKFNDYFGIRAGRVKTVLGLFNDTQDMEFIHTFALLPQSMYPTDLRASTISHDGGDIYGDISLKKAGRISYVAYMGMVPYDPRGGYSIGTRDSNTPIDRFTSWAKGGDVRWATPLSGLTVGYSVLGGGGHGDARLTALFGQPMPGRGLPYRFENLVTLSHQFYGDYQRGAFRTFAEYRMSDSKTALLGIPIPTFVTTTEAWYVAGTYRLHPKLEVGSYYNSFIYNRNQPFSPTNGIRGPVVSARFDLNRLWNVKVEQHFMDGYSSPLAFRSFYPSTNPTGFEKRTNAFIIRTGVTF
ncbi:MAG: hypothetical protein NTV70_02470 [Acidobacteria bacterium]|nr:hypothetical protein [Acidobacteriota bacterium]